MESAVDIVFGVKPATIHLPLFLYSNAGEGGPMKVTAMLKNRARNGMIWMEQLDTTTNADSWFWSQCAQGILLEGGSTSIIQFDTVDQLCFRLNMIQGSTLPLYRLVIQYHDLVGQLKYKHKYFGFRSRDKVDVRYAKYRRLLFPNGEDPNEEQIVEKLSSFPSVPTSHMDCTFFTNSQLLPMQ